MRRTVLLLAATGAALVVAAGEAPAGADSLV